MKKKLNNSQKITGWLAWAALITFLMWVTIKSIFGIISLFI